MAEICSMHNCWNPPREGQRYCPECHSKYMKQWREEKKLEMKLKDKELIKLRRIVYGSTTDQRYQDA